MGRTIVEKILAKHANRNAAAGDIVDIRVDIRAARDFGGANVVKHIQSNRLPIHDPGRTFFTFDCNPTGSDQKYATNQQACRMFARERSIRVFDIDQGIGTHLAIDRGLVLPGDTFVSTDSHANILGAICAFGQGMGDQDIAHAFAHGTVWFEVPASVRVELRGMPSPEATPKDVTLALLRHFGAAGLLGVAAEMYGEYIDQLDLAGRITMASMFTEMGAIIGLFPVNDAVAAHVRAAANKEAERITADADAHYVARHEVSIDGVGPMIARPGHPEDVVPVAELAGTPIDSALVGSCTNGRIADLRAAARILEGKRVADGVVLKIVPSTDSAWSEALEDGLMRTLKRAGALIGNAGCSGCAAGQIGQNGPGEVTVTTGNRNFAGKQGKGEVLLASPETVAASAIAGYITTAADLAAGRGAPKDRKPATSAAEQATTPRADVPVRVTGRAWVIPVDNIDTDMIFHNRHLAVTSRDEMGKYAFGNLAGYERFAKDAKPGDIVVTGKNFGAGSSRQQAVDCFLALGINAIVAESFGAIYERNAINAGMPVLRADAVATVHDGDEVSVDFTTGEIDVPARGVKIKGKAFSEVQLRIYQRGGLLVAGD
ncbi:MAG: aconitase family protein [Myxococcota bacterium]